jgi:hypothetical protein
LDTRPTFRLGKKVHRNMEWNGVGSGAVAYFAVVAVVDSWLPGVKIGFMFVTVFGRDTGVHCHDICRCILQINDTFLS